MRDLKITPEAIAAAAEVLPADRPIVMLNLLRYRERADYGDRADVAPCSGREAFLQRYSPVVRQIIGDRSQLAWAGSALASMVAPADEHWHDIVLVEYRNFAAFRSLVESPRYHAEAYFHRIAALEDARLIAMVKWS